jgi:hypothetical protein
MLDQGCGLEASPGWVRRQFLADTRDSNFEVNAGTITKRCIFVDEVLSSNVNIVLGGWRGAVEEGPFVMVEGECRTPIF